jgi:hypothetical protein
VLTETMAELYLKQGHQQDALRVYQALLAQRPNDAKLRSKIEQLMHGGKKRSGVSARGFLKGILSGRGAPAAPPEHQSTLAAAFDVAGPAPGGEPSHPAHDTISLDSVFGEEVAKRGPAGGAGGAGGAGDAGGTGKTGGTTAEFPDAPAAEGGPPGGAGGAGGAGGSGGGGFSFDEFFAGGKPPAGQERASAPSDPTSDSTPAAGKTPGRTSGRTPRPTEDEADADQFQQWLKKLKS